ncbi:MAG: Gfo/Idh/MocA family oxidoreductase [Verrucomicrobiota bacterium]|jgi:predicted dehydrogenase|nr:Gfo/Idh/MocA family oxidoreductase [Verrucomicrobiota bacterium]MDP7048869.1 Gfo/Idh/MocA family oxidoreductase [Verrucomicrobiota bacterium]
MATIGVGIIGCGGIALQNHLPGIELCPDTQLLGLCDSSAEVLERAVQQTGVTVSTQDYNELVRRDDIHAVIIATPNATHAPMAIAAASNGKHVLCEKPLGLDQAETLDMLRCARENGVRHMTAFTYRFVPAMRYMKYLVESGGIGQPYHIRTCRLQDWGDRNLGWRQLSHMAGSGELGDMLSHRLDYAHFLIGDMKRLTADIRRFIDDRQGQASDLEDWVTVMAEFENQATGVLESSKLATGRGEGARSQDYCEINGSEATMVFQLANPNQFQIARRGQAGLETIDVPSEFLVWPGTSRDPSQGDPGINFRWDQDFEFIDAIRNQRECDPSFLQGARVQAVMDLALQAAVDKTWLDVQYPGG